MIKPETLDALFDLLREMIADRREADPPTFPAWVLYLERIAISGCVVLFVVLVGLAAVAANSREPSPGIMQAALWIHFGIVLCGLGCILSALIQSFQPRYHQLLGRLHAELHADTAYLGKLAAYDKATLEYALLQYRNRWDCYDSRVGLLIGDLRKLGMFPAVAAYTGIASLLIRNESSVWLWMPLGATILFYLIYLAAYAGRERPQHVAELLRYAIEHATPSPVAAADDPATDAARNDARSTTVAVTPLPVTKTSPATLPPG